ncbi:MAG TPA: hypothetical protein VFW40_07800 [Capsulimonadaceae bacterium]|nr:hypothetical protein [Capsulimonadaceae bacterium]
MDADQPPLHVYWHHLGREHGGGAYAGDLRKNDPEIISRYLAEREKPGTPNAGAHRLIRPDENTLLELPPLGAESPFVIAYFIDKGLQYSFGYKKHPWWLIDVVEVEETNPNMFCVRDLFLDIQIYRDGRYAILDEEDYKEALRLGIMNERQIMRSVRSLKLALDELAAGAFPGPRLQSLIERYHAPAQT